MSKVSTDYLSIIVTNDKTYPSGYERVFCFLTIHINISKFTPGPQLFNIKFLGTVQPILTFILHLMPKTPGYIFNSHLVGMYRHRWSVYMDAKTFYRFRFSEIKTQFPNYLKFIT